MLTAVIPTLNRPNDLLNAIKSILTQTRFPDELIVVDQSFDEKSLVAVKNLMKKYEDHIKLIYVHDPAISGLVNAKQVSLAYSSGDIICFLEDDMIYESEYFEQIELGFIKYPTMVGCSGFITNQPNSSNIYKCLFTIFHRGIFKDPRMSLSYKYNGYNNKLIPSNMLSGGISAWRSEVFNQIQFDVKNNFHMYEDIEFSTRVAELFNDRLFINPNARLAHYLSPIPIGRSFHNLR